jgi:hypothetical protein
VVLEDCQESFENEVTGKRVELGRVLLGSKRELVNAMGLLAASKWLNLQTLTNYLIDWYE